jgi:ABC-type dipeptide/oligopeptide/nickel transport system ATPase component
MQTATDSKPGAVVFDRRQIYRPFLERLNPIGSHNLPADGLIVAPDHDPRDTGEPPIHVAFANTAELTRGSQMALVGGIGSGKTTELLLTQKELSRHSDAVNIFVDMADYKDLSEISPGAILATAGIQLYRHLVKKTGSKKLPDAVRTAWLELRELAFGKTKWIDPEAFDPHDDESGDDLVPVEVPGVMKLKFPALRGQVVEILGQLLTIASPLLEDEAQITLLVDGLDRLIRPELFREFAEQDLRALRGTKISVIIVAPLLFLYDKSRFVQDYFDMVKHIPAVAADSQHSAFLRQILERRGALELMGRAEVSTIAKYSGGVLRDLLTLARSSAEYAYRDDEDRIGRRHVNAAIKQLGNRYLVGLGNTQKRLLRRLAEDGEFPIENTTARELLVNRQVLDYFKGGLESFAVHPALAKVLPKPA